MTAQQLGGWCGRVGGRQLTGHRTLVPEVCVDIGWLDGGCTDCAAPDLGRLQAQH
jgi:hypothetical protein